MSVRRSPSGRLCEKTITLSIAMSGREVKATPVKVDKRDRRSETDMPSASTDTGLSRRPSFCHGVWAKAPVKMVGRTIAATIVGRRLARIRQASAIIFDSTWDAYGLAQMKSAVVTELHV